MGALAPACIRSVSWLLAAALCMLVALSAQAQTPAGFDVAGTVVNAISGDPVRGATLRLTPHAGTTAVAETRSADDGSFHFSGIQAGKYQLQATRRGYSRSLLEQHGSFNSAVIVAASQDTAHLVFHLPPMATIRGVVTGDGGEPVEAARVQLFRLPGSDDPMGKIYRAAIANTDDTGAYEFADLQPGEYRLVVMASPWYAMHSASTPDQPPSELDVAYPVTYFDSTTDEASAAPIRLTAGNRVEANLSLHAVPALRLTISKATGGPGPGLPILLKQTLFGTPENGEVEVSANVNQQGENELSGLAPGHYEMVTGDPARTVQLDLAGNGMVNGSSGVVSSPLSGRVETAPGVGYNELAVLTLVPDDANQHEILTGINEAKFSAQNLPAGVWTVKIRNGYGHPLQVHSIEMAGKKISGDRFTATGQILEMTITATQGAVNVVGMALKDGHGLPGAMIVLVPADLKLLPVLGRRDQTDSDGSFVLLNAVAGEYTVVAVEGAWELDWTRPDVIARYLPGGQSVLVPVGASGELRLTTPIAVQQR